MQVRAFHAYISTPTQDPQLLASFFQTAGHNTLVLSDHILDLCARLLTFSPTTTSVLLAVNNGVNSASCIAMGPIADDAERQNTLVGCVGSNLPFSYDYN